MAFPVNLISEADLITQARLASIPIETGSSSIAPDYERIRKWQAVVQPGTTARRLDVSHD